MTIWLDRAARALIVRMKGKGVEGREHKVGIAIGVVLLFYTVALMLLATLLDREWLAYLWIALICPALLALVPAVRGYARAVFGR